MNARTATAWLSLIFVAVAASRSLRAESDAPLGPRLVVRQEDYDFGKMETNNAGEHEFVFSNSGDRPLTLQQSKETCGCCTCVCETKLPEGGSIPPNGSAAVTLKWTIKRYTGAYHQTSTILTNDPRRPEVMLAVSGRVVTAVRTGVALLVARLTLLAVPEVRRNPASECAAPLSDNERVPSNSTRVSSAGTANKVSRATPDLLAVRKRASTVCAHRHSEP